jgi:hypothetical protein
MRRTLIALVAGCAASQPPSQRQPIEHPPASEAWAQLPAVIEGVERLHLESITRYGLLKVSAPACWDDDLATRVRAVYRPYVDSQHDHASAVLLHVAFALGDVSACLATVEGAEVVAGDPRFVQYGVFPAFAEVADGWILAGEPLLLADVVASKPQVPHPLATLLESAPPTGFLWTAMARDYTSDLLGVPSTGVIVEGEVFGPKPSRYVLSVQFADAATARLALERFVNPPAEIRQVHQFATSEGRLEVSGRMVRWTGTVRGSTDAGLVDRFRATGKGVAR